MTDPLLLQGEDVRLRLTPHPLAFLDQYALVAFVGLWGLAQPWLYGAGWFSSFTDVVGKVGLDDAARWALWWVGLLLVAVPLSVVKVRWTIGIGAGALLLLTTVLAAWKEVPNGSPAVAIPIMSVLAAILAGAGVDLYRRSHRYYVTNFRIIFQGGTVKRRERTIRYGSITDVDGSQGPFARIFDYGTIIPITQSGFGLGSDSAGFAVGIGAASSAPTGAAVGGAVGALGGREVQTPRARSFYQLTGVHPYRDVKLALEALIQDSTLAPELKAQTETLKRIEQLLRPATPDDVGAPPESA